MHSTERPSSERPRRGTDVLQQRQQSRMKKTEQKAATQDSSVQQTNKQTSARFTTTP